MKKILISFLVLSTLSTTSVLAQQIKGQVMDSSNSEPLPFANIVVVTTDTSAKIQGTVTDMDGNFSLPGNASQQSIRISYLGYETKETIVYQNTFNTISLVQDANMLGEVVVQAARRNFRMENGGISMDVANSPLNNIGTANDVLDKLPFVVKNGDDITVLGKGTPLIYINNRLVRNQQELEKLSSTTIKKITVITNPGPEYDASVSSVIRIEAIRQPGEGWGGEAFARLDARKKLSEDVSLDLNYRLNNLDIFTSYWYMDRRREVDNTLDRTMTTSRQTTRVYGSGIEEHHSYSHFIDAGVNYDFNDKHSIGAKYSYGGYPYGKFIVSLPNSVTIDGKLVEETFTYTTMCSDGPTHLVNAYYRGDFASWLKLQLDLDYSKGNDETRQNSLTERAADETVNTRSLQDYDLYAGKLTFTTPVWGNELKYGVEFSNTTNEQNYIVNQNEGAGELKSNVTLSEQELLAAFLGYSKTFGKWNLSLGARYEHVAFDYSENGKRVDEQSRSYNDLFPTASIDYQGEKVKMSLGFRSTIHRPGYYSLRNSIQFDDPYTYETGNPYLKPTKLNDLTYTLLWRDIKFMASYKMFTNEILFVPQQYQDTDILLFRPENADKRQNINLSAYYSPTFGVWSPTAGVGVSKDNLEYGEPVKYKYNKPYFFYSWQNSFRLPAGFTVMADIRGNGRGHDEMIYLYSKFRMDVGVTKTFRDGNLILNLRGTDILGTSRQKIILDAPPAFSLMDKKLDTRSFVLSVRYKFNTTRSKYKGESVSEEERQRL